MIFFIAQLLVHFSKLCEGDTPMVRRAAAGNLGELAKVVEEESLRTHLIPMFSALVSDKQVLFKFINKP